MGLIDDLKDFDSKDEASVAGAIEKLMALARTGRHEPLGYARNADEAKAAKCLMKATAKLSKGFSKAAKKAYGQYVKGCRDGVDDVRLLLAAKEYAMAAEFYGTEADYAYDCLDEFRHYARRDVATWLDMRLFGFDRPEEDLYDHRIR